MNAYARKAARAIAAANADTKAARDAANARKAAQARKSEARGRYETAESNRRTDAKVRQDVRDAAWGRMAARNSAETAEILEALEAHSTWGAVTSEYLGEGFSVTAQQRPTQAAPTPADGRPAFSEVRSYRVPQAGLRTHAERRPNTNPTPAYTGKGTQLAAETIDGQILHRAPGATRFTQHGNVAASQLKTARR